MSAISPKQDPKIRQLSPPLSSHTAFISSPNTFASTSSTSKEDAVTPKSPHDSDSSPTLRESNFQGRRPSIVGNSYNRRPSISSNIPRQQRSFSISSNDIILPIPQRPEESAPAPRLPSALTSFRKPSPTTTGQESYPYHMNILPEPHTNIEDLLSFINFKKAEKRFTIVGLDYECHVFHSVDEMWHHIVDSFNKRGKQFDSSDATMLQLHGDNIDRSEPIWVDIQQPSEEDMAKIEKYFNLHPLTTEDCIKNDTGEKWELFEDYMFVVFTGQVDEESSNTDTTTQLNILVYENYVVTIHDRPIKGLDLLMRRVGTEFEVDVNESTVGLLQQPYLHQQPATTTKVVNPQHLRLLPELTSTMAYKYDVTRSLTKRTMTPSHPNQSQSTDFSDYITSKRRKTAIPSSDWILYAFLDAMVDIHIPYVDSLLQEVENLDELVLMLSSDEHDDLLRRIGLTKKTIVGLRRLLYPKQKMTSYLVTQELKFVSDTVKVYLRDVLDHLAICIDKLELARENLMHTHSNYLTKVQIEIAQASSRTDDFMNRITILAAILAPLTLVTGLWGMNVQVPGGTSTGLEWFFGIVSGMFCMTLLIMIFLRRRLMKL